MSEHRQLELLTTRLYREKAWRRCRLSRVKAQGARPDGLSRLTTRQRASSAVFKGAQRKASAATAILILPLLAGRSRSFAGALCVLHAPDSVVARVSNVGDVPQCVTGYARRRAQHGIYSRSAIPGVASSASTSKCRDGTVRQYEADDVIACTIGQQTHTSR